MTGIGTYDGRDRKAVFKTQKKTSSNPGSMILSPITNQPVLMFVDDLRVTWTGGISGRRPPDAFSAAQASDPSAGAPRHAPVHGAVHPPLALTTVALFDQHPPMNALPQAGLRGKCPNRPKSDFLSEGEGNGVGGADGITQASLTTTQDRGCDTYIPYPHSAAKSRCRI